MLDNTNETWNFLWEKHLQSYLATTPRTGIFIKNIFHKKITSIIEIACGSSRDSIFLANMGYQVVATDCNEYIIQELKKNNSNKNLVYQCANAYHLPYKDRFFDLVFHNGFFICFNNDKMICQLLVEQERISKKYILILVHNALNKKLKQIFIEKAKFDPLYDVRFFTPDELNTIIKKSKIKAKKVIIKKFGGPMDLLNKKYIYSKIPNFLFPIIELIIPSLYQFQKWKHTERIACLIEIDN